MFLCEKLNHYRLNVSLTIPDLGESYFPPAAIVIDVKALTEPASLMHSMTESVPILSSSDRPTATYAADLFDLISKVYRSPERRES